MNLSTVINTIRSTWVAALPDVPLHLQLAPEQAKPPYAVFRIGTISPGEGDLADRDYETTAQMIVFTNTDSDCLATMDTIADTFDRGRMNDVYLTFINSATFDLNYADNASLWSAEFSVLLRWTKPV